MFKRSKKTNIENLPSEKIIIDVPLSKQKLEKSSLIEIISSSKNHSTIIEENFLPVVFPTSIKKKVFY